MSIWCSWESIGWEPEADVIYGNGRRATERAHMERGAVRAYRAGFSNHYPDDSDPGAWVDVASIPAWCVPGHDDERDDSLGPWLRLSVGSPDALTWWQKTPDDQPMSAPVFADVVLDEAAVRSLRDDLTAWLNREKARP